MARIVLFMLRRASMSAASARFVIQKHQATHLHYDFRLEMDNVLKSWAVPKEPPTQPGIRRLAVQVEDHELSYIDFEGAIPEGEYGAGTVEIWDKGTYSLKNRDDKIIEFTLDGSRLKGNYALINFKENNWLLIKKKA
jgi:DNA ligase D-like protein (predicted 3'-phosphoesterase)